MTSIGRLCLYCNRPLSTEDRVACCDRCYTSHHEECWDRNGRCSTFRCAGVPRTMLGTDLPAVLQSAVTQSNSEPANCPYCGSTAYAGSLSGKRPKGGGDEPAGPGLLFRSHEKKEGTGLISRLTKGIRSQTWWLAGAAVKSRSCARCRRLFVAGITVDDALVSQLRAQADERYCPHCATPLHSGEIVLKRKNDVGALFTCDEAPDLHRDWLGHNLLDRYVYNRWKPAVNSVPAHSCPECQYTEVAGRPIYRFL